MSRKKGPTLPFTAVLWKLSDFPISRSAETNKSNTPLKGELSSQEHKEDSQTKNKTRTLIVLKMPKYSWVCLSQGFVSLCPHRR